MQISRVKCIKYINVATIILYFITYLFGFFDIPEDLVLYYPDDRGMYQDFGMNAYTSVLWLLSISFTLNIVQYGIVQYVSGVKRWFINMLLNVSQLAVLGVALVHIVSLKVDDFGQGFYAAQAITLMRGAAVIFMCIIELSLVINIVLSIFAIKEKAYETEISEYKDRCFAYIPSVVALCVSLVTAASAESWRYEKWGVLFYLVVIGIPFALFNMVIIRYLMKKRLYVYAVCSHVLYLITANGVIYHINQRNTSSDYRQMTIVHTVVVLLTVVWLIAKHIFQKCKMGNQWKILVGLVAFLVMVVPFYRSYEADRVNYVYRTPLYSVTYQTDNGIEDYIGDVFIVKIFGMEVYRSEQEIMVLN